MRSITRQSMFGLLAVMLLNASWGTLMAVNAYAAANDQGPLLNPGFELGAVDALPADWTAPEIPGYATRTSDDDPLEGVQYATVICESDAAGRFGNLVQRIDATAYRGKRIRFRAAVRTAVRSAGSARLWLRVDRKTADGAPAMGAFDSMGKRPITSAEWKHYEIVADVAHDADRVSVGMMFSGPGQAWIDDGALDVVGSDLAITARSPQRTGGSGPAQAEVKPGLFEILGAMIIAPAAKTETDTTGGDPNTVMRKQEVLIPLPLAYRDQTPLVYELHVTPSASVNAVNVVRDGPHSAIVGCPC